MAEKQVATKGKSKVREESFGSDPGDISLSDGAEMATFGYRPRSGSVWPSKSETVAVNEKTGFPEGRN